MTEIKHWIGVGKVDKLIAKLEKYKSPALAEQEFLAIGEELEKLGIVFACGDYGDDYCLSSEGAIKVLKALKRYNEQ